jgi:alpha-1,3-rhamnosyl/mannosyltransferase
MPEFHPKERVMYFNRYFERSLRNADAIITPSGFTSQELRNHYPRLAAPVYSIHLGFNSDLFHPREHEELRNLKQRLSLPEKYILFVGTADPRKNVVAIMRALQRLPETIKLVCTGWSGWDNAGRRSDIQRLSGRVIFTGYVPDDDLALLYSGARLFVYPSLYEGFGLPLLEALACGCPVLCSNCASLPEIAGSAVAACPPHDIDCIAKTIAAVFDSDRIYTTMRAQCLRQAGKFNWTRTAEQTLRVFESLH